MPTSVEVAILLAAIVLLACLAQYWERITAWLTTQRYHLNTIIWRWQYGREERRLYREWEREHRRGR